MTTKDIICPKHGYSHTVKTNGGEPCKNANQCIKCRRERKKK